MPGKEACYRRRDTRSRVQPSGKHLCREGAGCPGGQIDHKPAMSFETKTNSILGHIMRSVDSRLWEVILPLWSVLVISGVSAAGLSRTR